MIGLGSGRPSTIDTRRLQALIQGGFKVEKF